MFNKYYEEELRNLRQLAVEFSKAHPVTAPMLSGPSMDPDAERLLQGVAFLTGLLYQKVSNEFPKLINEVIDIIFPHYIRTIPSASIVLFEPKPNVLETITVKEGTVIASSEIDGTSCQFQTCFEIDIHPLRQMSVQFAQVTGKSIQIKLLMELAGIDLSRWHPRRLCFFIGGAHTQAMDTFMLLNHSLSRIILRPTDGGEQFVLHRDALKPIGFDLQNPLLLFPVQSFSAYRLLQEYFMLPRKFTFMELTGWERWTNRGKGKQFEIIFEFDDTPNTALHVTKDTFIMNAVPVINLFRHEMDPVVFDHRTEKFRVRPSVENPDHYQVYDVESVTGYEQGSIARKEYMPLSLFKGSRQDKHVYQTIRSRSPVNNAPEVFLSFVYPHDMPEPKEETLSITVICTNGNLTERLQLGDICKATFNSPEMLTFRNILPPTFAIEPPSDQDAVWRLISHLSLNYLSLANKDNLNELLNLYVSVEDRDKARLAGNVKRIGGILDLHIDPYDRLFRGRLIRGQKIEMTVRYDQFAGIGDLYLFGCIMDRFFSAYSSMNTFTQFNIKEIQTGETFQWPIRTGDRPLN